MSAPVEPALLDAGLRAFVKHGYHDTTIERIATEAGLSRATLHRRGISKEGLLDALGNRIAEHYREAMWPALVANGTGRQRLATALDALCDQTEALLDLLTALRSVTDAIFHEPDPADGDVMTESFFTAPLERLLRDGIADGSLREVDAHEFGTVLFNLVPWTYHHLRTGHRWTPQRSRASLLDIAFHGLVTEQDASTAEPDHRP